MSRSNFIDPYAKYAVFKNAFNQVNKFKEEGNFLAAHVLAFSILEDRVTAAYVSSYRLLHDKNPPQHEDLGRIHFKNKFSNLHNMGVIDQSLYGQIDIAATERNKLTHEMMWRLNCFTEEAVDSIRNLINQVNKANRRFVKNQNDQRKAREFRSDSKGFGKRVANALNKAVVKESKGK